MKEEFMKLSEQMNDFIHGLVDEDKFSGAVLIAHSGTPFYRRAFGLASKAFQVPNQVDTKFNLGSMNKMFTAVAIGQLMEQGKLSFDDPVSKYLPDLSSDWADRVRIRHLLSHTSGLGVYWENERFLARWAQLKTLDDYLHVISAEELQFEPGSQFSYSNSGFVVLGAIIERASGESYFDYVKNHIFGPCGMTNTDSYDLEYDVPNLAVGYTKYQVETPNVWRNNIFQHVVKGNSAGGGYSTVDDLLLFSQALLQHKLLSPETTERMTSRKVDEKIPIGGFSGYGFFEDKTEQERIIGHSGGAIGLHSNMDIYMNSGYVVIALGNYDMGTIPICREFRKFIGV